MTRKRGRAKPSPRDVVHTILERKGVVTSGEIAERTGHSRQAVHRHLQAMVLARELFAEGAGRGARYVARRTHLRLARPRDGLDEARLFEEMESGLEELRTLAVPAKRILHYAFTEIVNNAVDHSVGTNVDAEIRLDGDLVRVEISDDGVGAFEKIRATFGLDAPVEAIGEVSKGKVTTDAARHSGQGLFFSSKAVDRFELESGELRWIVDNRRGDSAIGARPAARGTLVRFELDRNTTRSLKDLFAEYTTDLEFDRTRTVVRLFAFGVAFVSRSEAKRLLHGLERFREVLLDFTGVDTVGQGFVDEVFRVWARAHAATRIVPVNMLEPVAFMVRRAQVG